MNIQTQIVSKDKGFTIIEVVLVLAIAGLIFLMVFLALPALQKSQRDTQRKDDLSRINTQVQNYQSSNRGKIPDTDDKAKSFVQKYLNGSVLTASADEYAEPSSGEGYTIKLNAGVGAEPSDPQLGVIYYKHGSSCGDDGAIVSASGRQYTLRTVLEGQKALYCIDNK